MMTLFYRCNKNTNQGSLLLQQWLIYDINSQVNYDGEDNKMIYSVLWFYLCRKSLTVIYHTYFT